MDEAGWFSYILLRQMFLKPWLISMSIVATRMHRALTNLGSSDMCGFRRLLLLFSYCVVRRQSQLLRKCPKQRSPAPNPKSQGYSCDTPSAAPDSGGCKHG